VFYLKRKKEKEAAGEYIHVALAVISNKENDYDWKSKLRRESLQVKKGLFLSLFHTNLE
jgi:hypothetical protein